LRKRPMRATGKVRPALTDGEVAFFLSPRPPGGEGREWRRGW